MLPVQLALLEELFGAPAVVANLELDLTQATDVIVDGAQVGVRVRSYADMAKYLGQFTVRNQRTNGHPSEMGKIREGHGDYLLYAFRNAEGTGLAAWWLID